MYFQGDKFRSVKLSYAGDKQAMYVFLPDKESNLSIFLSKLQSGNWKRWTKSFTERKVNLSLPRFKVAYQQQLNEALMGMGMPDAFSEDNANFSRLVNPPGKAWISRVLQKTFMDVNEAGTEASAATAVMMGYACCVKQPEPLVEFRVDRPFVIALVDSPTSEIIFLGCIVDP